MPFKRLLDKDFAKDVSLKGYTDETLLNEVDGMTDLLYEKQGSYQQRKEDVAKAMLIEGDSVEKIVRVTKISKDRILELQAIVSKADG
jgi:predicted HAD superfamily Cof-like phosphohydrolase